MKRNKVISRVTKDSSSPEVLAARAAHEKKGYRITNMKETLLHSVTAFQALEEGTYAVDTDAVLILANNYWNNIVGTELDEYLYPYYTPAGK